MGAGIAAVFLRHKIPVVVYDNAPNAKQFVEKNLRGEFAPSRFDTTRQSSEAEPIVPAEYRITDNLSDLSDCTLVIESVVELQSVKQELLSRLETVVSAECVIGSNTSTIPVSILAGSLKNPSRFCGIHFLHPVRHRQLTEIIRADQSAESTLVLADSILRSVGQIPLWVRDCPGFVVNRLLNPYINEGLILLQSGVDMDRIDSAAANFGMAWGPIKTIDEIGIDTTFNAGRVLYAAFPDRITVSPILVTMYKSKCWGVKSGQGFRVWNGQAQNPKAIKWRQWIDGDGKMSESEIARRLIRPMWEEGRRIITEKIVDSPESVRIAACEGLAFPQKYGEVFLKESFDL